MKNKYLYVYDGFGNVYVFSLLFYFMWVGVSGEGREERGGGV